MMDMKELEIMKKILEHKEEFDKLFGKDNWKTRKLTKSHRGDNPAITLLTELRPLNVKVGDYVIVANIEYEGKPAVLIIPF